jgi:hypothetical protein
VNGSIRRKSILLQSLSDDTGITFADPKGRGASGAGLQKKDSLVGLARSLKGRWTRRNFVTGHLRGLTHDAVIQRILGSADRYVAKCVELAGEPSIGSALDIIGDIVVKIEKDE